MSSNIKNPASEQIIPSICDIMKSGTSEIIKKLEIQIPTYAQIYSDIYKEYLHTLDELYGVCYISEKDFYGKFSIDKSTMMNFENFWKSFVQMYSEQIDIQTNILKSYAILRIANMKSFDNFIHVMINAYSKSLFLLNSSNEKQESN